jgi:polar amino acid transport system ATP-binding protein
MSDATTPLLPGIRNARGMGENLRGLPMVRAQQVTKSVGPLKVLRGVTLEVQTGEVMCLLGPAGAGKSTFLRCVNHLERISAGRLYVQGMLVGYNERDGKLREMHPADVADQRREIGMVFQNFNLFPHLTVLGNVIEAPLRVRGLDKVDARDRGRVLLERFGLAGLEKLYPAQLSQAQQQLTAIARTLAMDPKLVLLDEPTSALDPRQAREVHDLIRQIAREGVTVLLATRDAAFARDVADDVAVLDAGALVTLGAPHEVLANAQDERAPEFVS